MSYAQFCMRVVCTALLAGFCTLPQNAFPNTNRFHSDFGHFPLYFEENRGQMDAGVRFIARTPGRTAFLTAGGLTIASPQETVSMRIVNANSKAPLTAEEPVEGISNYFLGARAITGVPHYGRVRVNNMLGGIDMVYYGNDRDLEYDLVIHPGASPSSIRMRFEGGRIPTIDGNGDVIVKTTNGQLRQRHPIVWQSIGGRRVEVAGRYEVSRSGDVRFIMSKYDRRVDLIVDPVLSFSSYTTGTDIPAGIAADTSGVYIAGANGSPAFPPPFGQGSAFVVKLNPAGTAVIYSTYIAGTSGYSAANAIAVDNTGNAWITGYTSSTDFPSLSKGTIIVVKLNATGKMVLSNAFGTYYSAGVAIALDSGGSAYVAAGAVGDATIAPNCYHVSGSQSTVAKFESTGAIDFITGISTDQPVGIAVDGSGNAYVAGTSPAGTSSIKALKSNCSALVYSATLGTEGFSTTVATGIAVDNGGNAYITGSTTAGDFATTPGAFMPAIPTYYNNANSQYAPAPFVTKLNPTGATKVYSTFLGGTTTDAAVGIAIDSSGAAYIAGVAQSRDFPTTPGALKTFRSPDINNDQLDMFVAKLSPDGHSLSYSTLFGTGGNERPTAVAVDTSGAVYIAGKTDSAAFPTTAGAVHPSDPRPTPVPFDFAGVVAKIDMSSPALCNASFSPPALNIGGQGGPFSFVVTLPAGCPWEAVPDSFISINPPGHGVSSSASVTIGGTVSVNPSTTNQRIGFVNVGSAKLTINQASAACGEPVLTPGLTNFTAAGGSSTFDISLPPSCAQTMLSTVPWITILRQQSGVAGVTTVFFSVANNPFVARDGEIIAQGKSIHISQSAGACRSNVVAPITNFSGQGGTGVVWVTTSDDPAYCPIQPSGPAWIRLAFPYLGARSQGVPFTVAMNPGTRPRTGQLVIAGIATTINQDAGPSGEFSYFATNIFAGGGLAQANLGDGGPAIGAALSQPAGLVFDSLTGILYIVDAGNGRIRAVYADGTISTIAGGGSATGENIPASSALLNSPSAIAVDAAGAIYIAEPARVRKISQGIISTIAGTGTSGFSGDNGAATSATLNSPAGLAVDHSGNLFIADTGNNRIRRVSEGTITTIAGGGSGALGDNGPAVSATLQGPTGIVFDKNGSLFVADTGHASVRKISQGTITTVAGGGSATPGNGGPATSALLGAPTAIGFDTLNNLYIVDRSVPNVRSVATNGTISTLSISYAAPFQTIRAVTGDTYGNVNISDNDTVFIFPIKTSFCNYYPPASLNAPGNGGNTRIDVGASPATCTWTAATDTPWITVSSDGTYTGTGSVSITFAPNLTHQLRTGSIAVGGVYVPVYQSIGVANTRDIRGSGSSDVVIYDPISGQEYTALSDGTSGTFSYVPNLFSKAFDILRFCDFNGDGKSDIVLYKSATGLAYIGSGDGAGHFSFQSLFWSPGYDQVAAGDLNGDGKTDFVLYRSSDGTMYTALSNGAGAFTYKYTLVSAGYKVTVADFSGDGKADIFLYRQSDGLANLGLGDGNGGFAFTPLFVSRGYDVVQTGDIYHHAKTDLLLYSSASGAAATGFSNGSGFSFSPQTWSPGFTSVRLLDFDGDGAADVTLYNRNTSIAYIGIGSGTGVFTFGSLFWGPGYSSVDVLDLNADGKMDVILYNNQNAASYSGISTGNAAAPFTFQYSYWGTNRLFAQ